MSLQRTLLVCGFQPGERFSVAAIRDKEIRPGCFTDASQAEAFLAQFKDWNHYLCGNPVEPNVQGRPGAKDVIIERVLLMDCDPAPDEAAARTACLKLAGWIFDHTGQYPTVVDSGRGCQVWVRVGALGQEGRRRLARGLAASCALTGAKWDATFDPSRLMRMPGSTNLKTGRQASILHEGTGPEIDQATLDKLNFPAEVVDPKKSTDFSSDPPTDADLAYLTQEARRIWDEPVTKGDRSKRDFRFLLCLVRARTPLQSASRLLWAMPGSKAQDDNRGPDYFDSTYASVLRHLAGEEKARALAFTLPEAAKDDAGAPFAFEALDALLLVRDSDCQAEWQRLRTDLKKAKVPIKALEDAMSARARAGVDVKPCELRYVAADAKRVGWFRNTEDRGWVPVDSGEVRSIMRAQGLDPDFEIEQSTNQPWIFVNEPFQPETLDGRRWNKDGARIAFQPEAGNHPTWDLLFNHVGSGIDEAVSKDHWCQGGGLCTGGDYLRAWCSALFKQPKARTAYLFFHGEQEAGKSSFHEALRMLFTRGYVEAGHALRSKEGFNGEIANAILCVIEEINLSDATRETHERVKKWVTGATISVRAMYRQAYDLENYTHWIQCAQKRSFMPVLPGDTRITEVYVEKTDSPLPRDVFFRRLALEAPAFLHTMLQFKLPEQTGRLFIPALTTEGKQAQAGAARTDLEEWLESNDWLEMSDDVLVMNFMSWVAQGSREKWDRRRILQELPPESGKIRRLIPEMKKILEDYAYKTSELFERLPAPIQNDWTAPNKLGRVLAKWYLKVPWLDRVVVRGDGLWKKRCAPTPQISSPTTPKSA